MSEKEEKHRAKIAALRLLGYQGRLSSELRQKLSFKGFSVSSIEWAIAECRRLGVLNDEEEVRRIADRYLARGYGTRWIALKLKAKAFSMDAALIAYCKQKEEEAQRIFLKKVKNKPLHLQRQTLQRRGFLRDYR